LETRRLGVTAAWRLGGWVIITGFVFGRREVVDSAVQTAVIPPVHPFGGRQFDLLD
jgi:hypothetical protein